MRQGITLEHLGTYQRACKEAAIAYALPMHKHASYGNVNVALRLHNFKSEFTHI